MNFESLANCIQAIQNALQQQAAHAVNMALTTRNWLTGLYIVEYEQNGEDRAAYGEFLLQKLEERLNNKGMTVRRFREYRRLYQIYPQFGQPIARYLSHHDAIRRLPTAEFLNGPKRRLPTAQSEDNATMGNRDIPQIPADRLFRQLPCTHLIKLSTINDPLKRTFYEIEALRGCWSVKDLDRHIASLYFERSGLSRNKEALEAIINNESYTLTPQDVIKAPLTLEFLGLEQQTVVRENDLEQAILDNIQSFLIEMGQGFCFEARQKRILVDEDYFNIDLVFYHRILKCHIIVELKADRFRHEYASQLNLYLNYYKTEVMQPDDNPPIGLLLCTDHGETIVKYATTGMDKNLFVRKYMVRLPSVEEIKEYISKNI
ncbi:MAG: PDDEXK nuclease domain-containing protein [Bacteroidales bacterium]|nr:PDDEXK nuclease domain-containing protein [Bacteroidales bacterium]